MVLVRSSAIMPATLLLLDILGAREVSGAIWELVYWMVLRTLMLNSYAASSRLEQVLVAPVDLARVILLGSLAMERSVVPGCSILIQVDR
jgi:hypothetical protein